MRFVRCVCALLFAAAVCGFASRLVAATVVCIGDSITQEIHLPASDSYPSQLGQMLRGVTMINAGVAGNTSSQGWARWSTDVAANTPSYVAIMFGTNDSVMTNYNTYQVPVAQFTTNLQNMAHWCMSHGAKPIICSLPPIIADMYFDRHPRAYYDAAGGLNADLQNYCNAAQSVAQAIGATFIPIMDIVGKDMSLIRHDERDGVHYTADGDYVQASAVYMAIAAAMGQPAGDIYVTGGSGPSPQLWNAASGTPQAVTASTVISNPSTRIGIFDNSLYLVSRDDGSAGSFGGVWKYDGSTVSPVMSVGGTSDLPVSFTVYQSERCHVWASVNDTAWNWNVTYAVPEPKGMAMLLSAAAFAIGWIGLRLA